MKKLPFIFNFYYLYSISLHLKHPALMSPGPWKYSSMETAASPKFTRLKKRTRLISWCSQLLVWANRKHVCWHFHSRADITSSYYFLVNTPSSKTNTPNIPPDNHYQHQLKLTLMTDVAIQSSLQPSVLLKYKAFAHINL